MRDGSRMVARLMTNPVLGRRGTASPVGGVWLPVRAAEPEKLRASVSAQSWSVGAAGGCARSRNCMSQCPSSRSFEIQEAKPVFPSLEGRPPRCGGATVEPTEPVGSPSGSVTPSLNPGRLGSRPGRAPCCPCDLVPSVKAEEGTVRSRRAA